MAQPLKVKRVKGDHDFDLSDDFSDGPLRITQTCYFKGDKFVLAIGELNRPNLWDDERFDRLCNQIEDALNSYAAQVQA